MTTNDNMLNALLEALLDNIAGYAFVADASFHSSILPHCARQATERRKLTLQLGDQMEARCPLGQSHGILQGSMHRLFVDLEAALAESEEAAMKALRRGDALLSHMLETALIVGQLNGPIEQVVRSLCRVISEGQSEWEHRSVI